MNTKTLDSTVTIIVNASDARLMGEALLEMKREWADAGDAATTQEGEGFERMREYAAERVGGALHEAGWKATQS